MNRQKIFAAIKLGALILLPLFLYAIPKQSIFNGESICLFRRIFGVECWGCGTTRAIFSVLYGNFKMALEYNRMIVVLFPLLLWLWGSEVYKTIRFLRVKN